MLEKLMKLYAMAMAYDVRSPLPHIVGPPGCGKSTSVEQLADLLGVNLHIINVSRISPLELEGVMMPQGLDEEQRLRMLTATHWTQLKEGDILLLDEFLRGFPEVYNGLLDIFTSRRVGSYVLPKVFIVGASNSVVAYDQALEDRLLHLPVTDPRKSKVELRNLGRIMVDALGLLPAMAEDPDMVELLEQVVLPMYDILDSFTKKGVKAAGKADGQSLRKLIGQVQLRTVKVPLLKDMINRNNQLALQAGKAQYVVLLDGKNPPGGYVHAAEQIKDNPRLSEVQRTNVLMNLELVALSEAAKETEEEA